MIVISKYSKKHFPNKKRTILRKAEYESGYNRDLYNIQLIECQQLFTFARNEMKSSERELRLTSLYLSDTYLDILALHISFMRSSATILTPCNNWNAGISDTQIVMVA